MNERWATQREYDIQKSINFNIVVGRNFSFEELEGRNGFFSEI
jgi:hypothetical protein